MKAKETKIKIYHLKNPVHDYTIFKRYNKWSENSFEFKSSFTGLSI